MAENHGEPAGHGEGHRGCQHPDSHGHCDECDENGLAPGEWVEHPALQAAAIALVGSMEAIKHFAAQHARTSI